METKGGKPADRNSKMVKCVHCKKDKLQNTWCDCPTDQDHKREWNREIQRLVEFSNKGR